MERLSSRQNTHFKLARKLAESARERSKNGKLLLDGTRLIRAYTDQSGFEDVLLLLNELGAVRSEVRELVDAARPRNFELERLDDGLDLFHAGVTLPPPCFQIVS